MRGGKSLDIDWFDIGWVEVSVKTSVDRDNKAEVDIPGPRERSSPLNVRLSSLLERPSRVKMLSGMYKNKIEVQGENRYLYRKFRSSKRT